MDRRKLLSWFGLGWLVSSFPVAISACSNSGSSNSAKTTSRIVGTVADLNQKGIIIKDGIAVLKNPNNSATPIALSLTCTHKGCVVNWQDAQKEFVCPCHGAKYGSDGAVRQGPAKQPLDTFAVKVENGQISVSA